MDLGHMAPQFTVLTGCRVRLDAEQRRFEVTDAAVEQAV
jgi:hypothetical protein